MAATNDQQASSSSSSGPTTYAVFLSFCGVDVRKKFADYLYEDFVGSGIRTFRDEEELRMGLEIRQDLLDAIEQSAISIPILSINYASSRWCLDELAHMVKCKDTKTIKPIFYGVERKDVQEQTGKYEKAFEDHQKRFDNVDNDMVQKWRDALAVVGKLEGWDLKDHKYQGKLVKEVVHTVSRTLKERNFTVSNKLVGIQSHIDKMLVLLDRKSVERIMVGIHGLGGIGKTTIARVVYDKIRSEFNECSFIENIRENTEKYGISHLQNQLIYDILKQKNIDANAGVEEIRERCRTKKVLIVLDDVDQDIQIKSLVGDGEWFHEGSRIIITSRDRKILGDQKPNRIYKPEELNFLDSLKLFSLHAFGMDQPLNDYMDVSKAVVRTIGGHPLALQIIGSSLASMKFSPSTWEGMLKKLENIPINKVVKRLRISYDGLEHEEQQMFLDTACFLIGMDKDIACYIWEGCNFYPQVGLEILRLKSLIDIGEDGKLVMHDMVRDLGRNIVLESQKKLGKRSRIWSQEDVFFVLQTKTGTSYCEGLNIDFNRLNADRRSRIQCLMSEGFAPLTGLRLLRVDNAKSFENSNNSFSELRWLSWRGCPAQYVLNNFCPWKLVVLDLSDSEITEEWMGWNDIKKAGDLKVLNLTSCQRLHRTPDLSENQKLEVLILSDCQMLVEVHPSFGKLKNLITLDMSSCESLKHLPRELSQLTSLKKLDLSWCSCIEYLPDEICQMTSMEMLLLNGLSFLQKLPEKLGGMISLTTLDLTDCFSLEDLPKEICQLASLKTLRLKGCSCLEKVQEKLSSMASLTFT